MNLIGPFSDILKPDQFVKLERGEPRRCCVCGDPIKPGAPAIDLNPEGSQARTDSLVARCCFFLLPDAIIRKHKKHMLE